MSTSTTRRSTPLTTVQKEDRLIRRAIALLEARIFKHEAPVLTLPTAMNYFQLRLVPQPNEVFAAIFLNSHLQALAYEALSTGSITETHVNFRVVAQRVLAHNAAAVIFAHQHVSGSTTPSPADRKLTEELRDFLLKIDVRLLDHLVIGQGGAYSFAEAGQLQYSDS
ncbi:JAB domain-containing protein [Chitinimonas lacunae]|uniref:JAB domain-containing protein n=1 Tax=Chitinimonas lacunae TaxID=1963018 RepID=A0ABV8MSK9_9NEIS